MEQKFTKMKTYRTLFVTISKDKYHKDFEVHRFPYSSDENANAAFDSWVAKAKEVLEDRLESFLDLSDEFQKEASFLTDDGIQIDVNVQDYYWDTLKTVPLDLEMEELEKKNQEWIDTHIKEAIKDLANVFYTHPEENVCKSDLLDEVKECAFGVYGISSEEVSEFSKNHSIVAIYCKYLEDAGEITDWEWDGPNRNYAKLVLSE